MAPQVRRVRLVPKESKVKRVSRAPRGLSEGRKEPLGPKVARVPPERKGAQERGLRVLPEVRVSPVFRGQPVRRASQELGPPAFREPREAKGLLVFKVNKGIKDLLGFKERLGSKAVPVAKDQ